MVRIVMMVSEDLAHLAKKVCPLLYTKVRRTLRNDQVQMGNILYPQRCLKGAYNGRADQLQNQCPPFKLYPSGQNALLRWMLGLYM